MSLLPRGIGVGSAVLGDCGMGDKAESRKPPCNGIMGVISGDERGWVDMEGGTAGSIVSDWKMVVLRSP